MVTPEKQKILIIDDDPATLDLLSFVFTQNGYQVVTGKNGREAVEDVRQKLCCNAGAGVSDRNLDL